jgi:hypothetical protein
MMNYSNPNDPWQYDPYKGMSEEERMKAGCFQGVFFVLAFLIGLIICALLSSCSTTKVVEVEKVRTDTTYITKWQRDSVWLHDSIHVTEKGDTVRIERWHTKYVENQVHDTTYVANHDTIPQPYEVVKEVPAELSWWQRVRLWLGNAVLLVVIVFVGHWILKIYKVWKYGL